MIKQNYSVCSVDSFRDPVFQPKPIKCLRFVRDKDAPYGELYEYVSNQKSLFLFRSQVRMSGKLLAIKVLPGTDDNYTILRTVLMRNKIRGKYIKDDTIPFEFVLKEIDEINI